MFLLRPYGSRIDEKSFYDFGSRGGRRVACFVSERWTDGSLSEIPAEGM